MKITTNNVEYFRCLADVIPEPNNIPFNFIFDNLSVAFKTLFQELTYSYYADFMIEYVSKSMNKKLSSYAIQILNIYGLKLYDNSYYSFSDNGIKSLLHTIEGRYNVKWRKLFNTLTLQYSPLKPYDMSITEETEESRDSSTTVSSNSSDDNTTNRNTVLSRDDTNDSTFGFNSDLSVPTDSSNRSSVTSNDERNTNSSSRDSDTNYHMENPINRNISRSGNIGNITQQELLEKERKVWVYQLWDTIFKDLDKVLVRAKYI